MVFPRLYAILDPHFAAVRGVAPTGLMDAWLDAGVRLIQLRSKQLPSAEFLALADELSARAHAAGATFIVNDRADVARMCGADGVHVGQTDLPPAAAREVVGSSAIVGVSTHNEAQLERALRTPADYLAIGPVFQTTAKDNPDPVVGLEGIASARARLGATDTRPLVAIGGITLERALDVIHAGATSVAIISDLLMDNPAARARAFIDALR